MDVVTILEKLESEGFIRLNKITNNYYSIYCPFHNNGNEKKPSCGVLIHEEYRNGNKYPTGWCHCFTCGYAKPLPDMVGDLLKERHISKSGLEWLKENIPGFEIEEDSEALIPNNIMDTLNDKFAIDYIKSFTTPKPNYISEEELQSYRYTVDYMYERGLTDELIEKFDIGFDENFIPPGRKNKVPSITFPVRDAQGNTLFIVRRSIQGKFFSMPKGITKPLYGIYELPKGIKSVMIVESCFNCLTCWKYGKPAVALLGTGDPYQINQLKQLGLSEYILALDPDDGGKRGTFRLKKALKNVGICWELTGIPEGKDINDLSKEEFDSLELE